jgi:hypothetical protein
VPIFLSDPSYSFAPFGPPAPFGFGGYSVPGSYPQYIGNSISPGAAQGSVYVGSSAPALPVGDNGALWDNRRPGFSPVPPDIFSEWRKHAELGLLGLLNAYRGTGSWGNEGGRSDPDCKDEWDDARDRCANELAKTNPAPRMTGRYPNIEDCARGFVSERCGGNAWR